MKRGYVFFNRNEDNAERSRHWVDERFLNRGFFRVQCWGFCGTFVKSLIFNQWVYSSRKWIDIPLKKNPIEYLFLGLKNLPNHRIVMCLFSDKIPIEYLFLELKNLITKS